MKESVRRKAQGCSQDQTYYVSFRNFILLVELPRREREKCSSSWGTGVNRRRQVYSSSPSKGESEISDNR